MSDKKIVAVYDFRSKQEYIYRTNRVKEIIGASEIIKNAYQNAIENYNEERKKEIYEEEPFSMNEFSDSDAEYAKLYEGGGNIVMMFKSQEGFIAFNNFFSMWLIKNAPGLSLICGSYEFDNIVVTMFTEVTKKVFADLSKYKRSAPQIVNADVLPFTQIDFQTSLPVIKKNTYEQESLSAESVAKLTAYDAINADSNMNRYVQSFDTLVQKKGTESLLAIIYIDGNGMGKRVANEIPNNTLFEEGIKKQRAFTEMIDDAFVKNTIDAIENKVGATNENRKTNKAEVLAMRRVIGGGDEITIVCNAREALNVIKVYFKSLAETSKKQSRMYSACAGVAICHSHAPFSVVYEIAEQCCESGKKRIKALGHTADDNCYFDAFFCHSAITADMESLRKEQVSNCTKMPYCITGIDTEHSFSEFDRVAKDLRKINRTNVKALRDAAFRSSTDFVLELKRTASNCKYELKLLPDDRPIVCDVAEFYDIWFGEGR